MSVGRICSRTTHLADPDESIQAAAARMRDENVGTLLVIDPDRRPIGIVTDRDLALRVVGRGLESRTTTVDQVMTPDPRCVRERTTIECAAETMCELEVRRLPVVDEKGRLVGIVTMDDVLELVTEEMGDLRKLVGSSHPRSAVRAATPPRATRRRPATAGLERASSDPEC